MHTAIDIEKTEAFENASFVTQIDRLSTIHQQNKNIAIYERDVDHLVEEIGKLQYSKIQMRLSGTREELLSKLAVKMKSEELEVPQIQKDIETIIKAFEKITSAKFFRLHLLSINNNMCSKFHTDINDLRLLCSYSGSGTCWLPSIAVERLNHQINKSDDEVAYDQRLVQQANVGDIVILKGALYPESEGVLHKSPRFEDGERNRILLRIDTNQFGSFI